MRNTRGIIGIVLITLCFKLMGCATIWEDARISKAESQGLIKIGMTLNQVAEIVGRGVQSQDYYHENTTEYGRDVTWEPRSRLISGTTLQRIVSYTFLFKNDRLISWSKSGSD